MVLFVVTIKTLIYLSIKLPLPKTTLLSYEGRFRKKRMFRSMLLRILKTCQRPQTYQVEIANQFRGPNMPQTDGKAINSILIGKQNNYVSNSLLKTKKKSSLSGRLNN